VRFEVVRFESVRLAVVRSAAAGCERRGSGAVLNRWRETSAH